MPARRYSRILIDRRFDHSGGLALPFDQGLDAFDGLGGEELFARLRTNPRRHMLDDVELPPSSSV